MQGGRKTRDQDRDEMMNGRQDDRESIREAIKVTGRQ